MVLTVTSGMGRISDQVMALLRNVDHKLYCKVKNNSVTITLLFYCAEEKGGIA